MQHLMTVLISEHSRLYQCDEPEPENNINSVQRQSPVQRCKVEWVLQDPDAALSSGTNDKSPTEKPHSLAPSSDSKTVTAPSPTATLQKEEDGQLDGKDKSKTDEKVEEKADNKSDGKGGSEVAVSPSKQSKALPSWKSSFKGNASSAGARGKIGGSAGDVSATGGSNWLINGLSSFRAHRRTTSSGERLKDSTLSLKDSTISLKEATLSLKDSPRDGDEESRTPLPHRALHQPHRLSAYDNVAPSSLSLPADTSIWTSFEISLAEPEESDKKVKAVQVKERPSEVRESTNAVTADQSGSGTEDDNKETNDDLADLLTQLKQELKKQRTTYESNIHK